MQVGKGVRPLRATHGVFTTNLPCSHPASNVAHATLHMSRRMAAVLHTAHMHALMRPPCTCQVQLPGLNSPTYRAQRSLPSCRTLPCADRPRPCDLAWPSTCVHSLSRACVHVRRDLASIGDTVLVSATKEGIKFSTSGDVGTANITLR